MNKNQVTIITMAILTTTTLGGVIIAIAHEAPSFAVCLSFTSLILNYTLGTQTRLIRALKWSNRL